MATLFGTISKFPSVLLGGLLIASGLWLGLPTASTSGHGAPAPISSIEQPRPPEQAAASVGIGVSVTVNPVRYLVVDEAGNITQVWSNTRGDEFRLAAKLGSSKGTEVPLTAGILAQYESLKAGIDWSKTGRVY